MGLAYQDGLLAGAIFIIVAAFVAGVAVGWAVC